MRRALDVKQLKAEIDKQSDLALKTIPSSAQEIDTYLNADRLLQTAYRIDLCLYTAETVVAQWRPQLLARRQPLMIRLLVRRPETDPEKHQVAEAIGKMVEDIISCNDRIGFDIHYYDHEPWLRLHSFERGEGDRVSLAGLYHFDEKRKVGFVGAENSLAAILKSAVEGEKRIGDAIASRFQHAWVTTSCIRSVVFDLDGVLVDSMGSHYESWGIALKAAGVAFDENRLRADVYRLEGAGVEETVSELVESYIGRSVTSEEMRRIIVEKNRVHLELVDKVLPMEGIDDLIKDLTRKRIPLAVVTGSSWKAAHLLLAKHFWNRFAVVITGSDSDVKRRKPDPEPYDCAGRKLGVGDPRQCVVIEDVRRVIRYLQREIRHERRNVGALKLSNLLRVDQFEEDLNISHVRLQPPSAPKSSPPKEPQPPVPTPEEQARRREAMARHLAQLRASLRLGPSTGINR